MELISCSDTLDKDYLWIALYSNSCPRGLVLILWIDLEYDICFPPKSKINRNSKNTKLSWAQRISLNSDRQMYKFFLLLNDKIYHFFF